MTDKVEDNTDQEQAPQNPIQGYLQGMLNKFNENPEDPDIGETERVLLLQIRVAQQEISIISEQIDTLNKEIRERQDKGNILLQQLISKRGESQGYLNTLLKLKEEHDKNT